MGNRRRYRLNKNLTKYLSTVHDVQKDLVQLNQTLNEVSSNREMDENLNDKIRLSIWQINSMQVTLNTLVGLEKEAKWSKNRHSTSLSSDPLVPTVQLPKKSSSLMGKTDYPSINNQEFLEKVFIIIRENYVDPHFNVDTLSYKMGMSRSSFFNKIKAISGRAPADFIRQYRMERAKELLITKQYTISEIAYKTGFSDVKYFRDVFKKKYNQSPSQYAKMS